MSCKTRFTVPRDLPCFSGHFPGNPLVPGALLLSWVAREYQHLDPRKLMHTIKSAKFLQPVRPGTELEFEFFPSSDTHGVRFSISMHSEPDRIVAVTGHGVWSEV